MILKYTDKSIRIAVTGAFTKKTWEKYSTILWLSDRLPIYKTTDPGNGDSLTFFKKDLKRYLKAYNSEDIEPWIDVVDKVNFKNVDVFFIFSTPGVYSLEGYEHETVGHPLIKDVLSKYSAPIHGRYPIVAQTKVLSYFGRSDRNNYLTEVACSFAQDSNRTKARMLPDYNIVFTSSEDVKDSYHESISANYSSSTHHKQEWVDNLFYNWRSHTEERTRALYKIKSYARWSENGLFWFMFGSFNLTRSALGSYKWRGFPNALKIRNFELALLFMPRIMVSCKL